MMTIAKTPLNKHDITHLIDMTLENKMPWITLENLLKDLATYDPKQVIETLLKALKKLHLKMLKNDYDYTNNSFQDVYIEGERFSEKTSFEVIGETKSVRDLDEVHSSIGDDNSVNEDITESVEDDIEILEVVRETIDEDIPFDMKTQTNDVDATCTVCGIHVVRFQHFTQF